jgi:hypothetical protein
MLIALAHQQSQQSRHLGKHEGNTLKHLHIVCMSFYVYYSTASGASGVKCAL